MAFEEINLRKLTVLEGRCMVRVIRVATGEKLTAAMCPGCWNDRSRRKVLTVNLERMGLTVAHYNDFLDGKYQRKSPHAPLCPYDPQKRDRISRLPGR